jgi:hypothetical protein
VWPVLVGRLQIGRIYEPETRNSLSVLAVQFGVQVFTYLVISHAVERRLSGSESRSGRGGECKKFFCMPGIELQSSSLCAVALQLTLTRRHGVEPHVLTAVSSSRTVVCRWRSPVKRRVFTTYWDGWWSYRTCRNQYVFLYRVAEIWQNPFLLLSCCLITVVSWGCDRCFKRVWRHDTPGTQNLGRDE